MINEEYLIMSVEPSKRLSELCGSPYLVEKRVAASELLKAGHINESDIAEMRTGKQICIQIPVVNEG
ncbi:hypothetical protein LCGC14_2380260 [marine sediment metagenome]|uniref:Uncharacterized protein n=1 Tax=marine sediment metagenome TaxID=412755 RepID=A0A0F9CNA9_9ZZZZ